MPSDALPDDLETLKAMLLAEQCESERLRQIIKEMQRHCFGRRAETLPEDQMLLGLEDVGALARRLAREDVELLTVGRSEVDLRDQAAVFPSTRKVQQRQLGSERIKTVTLKIR